jgi:hypothetical protein
MGKVNLDKFSEIASNFLFGASLSFRNWEGSGGQSQN